MALFQVLTELIWLEKLHLHVTLAKSMGLNEVLEDLSIR
jgi:hypothetical protein